jgi:hypothetical protein
MPRVITIQVASEALTCDLQDLEIVDPEAERHKVAALVAWWGSVSASAESHAEKLAARAANWHNAALTRCIGEDAKVPEWKAKAYVGGQPEYLALLEAAADGRAAHSRANSIHWSYVRKMEMLKAMLQGERATQGSANELGRIPEERTPTQTDNRFDRFKRRGA